MFKNLVLHILTIQGAVTRLAAPPGNLLEVRICGPYCRPTESESLGRNPEVCVMTGSPGDSVMHENLRNTALNQTFIILASLEVGSLYF